MLDQIKNRFIGIKKAAGIELILKQDDLYEIRLVILSLEKKKVILEKNESFSVGIEELAGHIPADTPLSIAISGRGILHKKMPGVIDDDNNLLQSILPNAKVADFYLQKLDAGNDILVSIVRRETIDKLLTEFQKQHLYVVNLSVGGLAASNLLTFVSLPQINTYKIAEHSYINDQQGNVHSYSYSSAEVDFGSVLNIENEKIEEKFFVSYAAAFNLLLGNDEVNLAVEAVRKDKKEFTSKLIFKLLSWTLLIFFLFVLLVNYILFMSFSQKHDTLISKDTNYKNSIKGLELLQKEVTEKEGFLSEAGWLGSSRVSYYADRIAYTVPPSVSLTEMSVYPVREKESKLERKNLFDSGMIKLLGNCTKPTELNEWIEKVKNIDKVKQAKLLHYSYDHKDNIGSFSVEIILED